MSLPDFLKKRLRIPAIGSPLLIVSNPDLVIAQCTAGIVGSFPALNARPAEMLDEWLKRITGKLAEWDAKHPDRPSAPFAVNQIVHRTNERLAHDVEMCVKHKVPRLLYASSMTLYGDCKLVPTPETGSVAYPHLFEPITVGTMQLRNRLMLPPHACAIISKARFFSYGLPVPKPFTCA